MNPWWHGIIETWQADFSDLPDVQGVTRLLTRLFMASLLGGLLGYEREARGKHAGLRTHMLVSMGAALFVLVPSQAGVPDADLSRVIQGIVTGIGFVGAGSILKLNEERRIEGLTTAAGIWLTAAVGIAAGMGKEASAILGTLLALFIFLVIGWLEGRAKHHENGNGNQQSKIALPD